MSLTQVGSSIVTENTSTSLNLPVPAGLQTNDLVVACVRLYGTASTDTITPPAGFVEIADAHVLQTSVDSAGDDNQTRFYWKRYAGETGTYTFSWTNGNYYSAGCNVVRGAPTIGDPIDHTGLVKTATINPTLNLAGQPGGTQTWQTSNGLTQPGEMVLGFLLNDMGGSSSGAGSMNRRQDTPGGPVVLDLTYANAGPTVSQVLSITVSADQVWVAIPILSTQTTTTRALPSRPHLAFPFSRSADGTSINVVEQGSEEEVMACVQMIARCPLGYREDRPEFGWDWPDLRLMPINPQPLLNAIQTFEPRAVKLIATEDDAQALADAALGVQDIDVDVYIQSGDSTGVSQEND